MRKNGIIKKDEPIYLTQEGRDRLEKELAHLNRILPGLREETARTAAYGDRSDNAEYKQAKSSLRRANWRVLEIQDELKRVSAIKTGPSASGAVQLGSTVTLEAEGEKKIFQIVGPQETDPAKGRISHASPLGAALLHHAVGDDIIIQTGKGPRAYRVLAIS